MTFRSPHILFALALLAVTIMGCQPEDTLAYQQRQYAAVEALLKTGGSISDINIRSLNVDGKREGITDLSVHIRSEVGNYFLTENEEMPGNYFYSDRDEQFVEGETYSMTFDFKGEIVRAETTMPPALESLNVSSNVLRAEQSDDRIWIDWSDINTGSTVEYFYVVKLTPLENDQSLVPLPERCTECDYRSGEVVLNPRSTLDRDDFAYYGAHRLEVLAVHNSYKHLFKEDSDSSINGMTNIANGTGYFVGVSALSTVIEVE